MNYVTGNWYLDPFAILADAGRIISRRLGIYCRAESVHQTTAP